MYSSSMNIYFITRIKNIIQKISNIFTDIEKKVSRKIIIFSITVLLIFDIATAYFIYNDKILPYNLNMLSFDNKISKPPVLNPKKSITPTTKKNAPTPILKPNPKSGTVSTTQTPTITNTNQGTNPTPTPTSATNYAVAPQPTTDPTPKCGEIGWATDNNSHTAPFTAEFVSSYGGSGGKFDGNRWDFNNDGSWDTDFNFNEVSRYTYTEPGTYHAKFQSRAIYNGNYIYSPTCNYYTSYIVIAPPTSTPLPSPTPPENPTAAPTIP